MQAHANAQVNGHARIDSGVAMNTNGQTSQGVTSLGVGAQAVATGNGTNHTDNDNNTGSGTRLHQTAVGLKLDPKTTPSAARVLFDNQPRRKHPQRASATLGEDPTELKVC